MDKALLGEVPWFDQSLAYEFFFVKGVLGLIATALILGHMSITWATVETRGRRWRYYALLCCCALITFASVEQAVENEYVDFRHLAALACICVVIVAMVASIREDVTRRPGKPT